MRMPRSLTASDAKPEAVKSQGMFRKKKESYSDVIKENRWLAGKSCERVTVIGGTIRIMQQAVRGLEMPL